MDNFQGNYRLPKLGLLEQKFRKTHFCRKQRKKLRNYPHRKESGPDGSKWSLPSFKDQTDSPRALCIIPENQKEKLPTPFMKQI